MDDPPQPRWVRPDAGSRANGATETVPIPARRLLRGAKWALGLAFIALATEGALWRWPSPDPVAEAMHPARRMAGAAEAVTADPHAAAGAGAHSAAAGCDEDSAHKDTGIAHPLNSMLSAVLLGFLLSALLDHLNMLVPESIRFPISCIIFLTGCIVDLVLKAALDNGGSEDLQVFLAGRNSFSYFNPHALFFIILPPLLFESSSGMSWHVLRKVLPSSVILALPGVIINVILTTLLSKGFLIDSAGHTFSWEAMFLLASILSATDPVAVVSALRSLGAPAKLSSLIDGESLLNDGSAFVVFMLFFDSVGKAAPDEEKLCPGDTPGIGCIIGTALRLAAGGSALGALSGFLVRAWIRRARFLHAAALEETIVLLGVYGSFFVAECLRCSGVLAVVVYGIVWAAAIWPVMSHEGRHTNHMVLATFAYLCDKIIFFIAGMVSIRFIREPAACGGGQLVGKMFGILIALYFLLHFARGIVVAVFVPALTRLGYGFNWKEGLILVYGGLRGALALAMGLIVEHNQYIPHETSSAIAFYTSGIVFLTLVVNGSTVDTVYKRLCVYPANKYRIRYLKKRLQHVEKECVQRDLYRLQEHWFFNDCHFDRIFRCVPNFGKVEFDGSTGTPMATGIMPVKAALRDLEFLANRHMRAQLPARGRYFDNFEFGWKERHDETTHYVAHWLADAVSVAGSKGVGTGDLMDNVLDFDEGGLEFRRLGTTEAAATNAGLYVSRRSLAAVTERLSRWEDLRRGKAQASFSIEMVKMGKERVVVGLCTKVPTGDDVDEVQGDLVLGGVSCSAGLDCSTGRVVYNWGDDHESSSVQTRWEVLEEMPVYADCSRGSRISGMKRAGDVVHGFQIGLWLELVGEPGYLAMMQGPGVGGGRRNSRTMTADDSHLLAMSLASSGAAPPMPSSVLSSSAPDAAPDDVPEQPQRGRQFSKVHGGRAGLRPVDGSAVQESWIPPRAGDTVRVAVSRSKGQPWRISFFVVRSGERQSELVGILRLGEFPPEELHPAVEFRPARASSPAPTKATDTVADTGSTKVRLSFHPEVVDEHDSLHQVFITLFNSVSHHYQRQHEHGVIGETSLRWLTEAASHAIDSANRDKHAARVCDFKHVLKSTELDEALQATMGPATTVRKSKSQKTVKKESNDTNPFSPIIVEYLSIENRCARVSWWDHYPRSWKFDEFVRSFGYFITNAKVECLVCFVEAHERVLEELAHLERFAAVRCCLEHVISAAKRDLRLVEELNPRRFYYSKHALVLKICVGGRRHRLQEQVEEGWIAEADAEPLISLARDRLGEIQSHRPRVVTNWRATSKELGNALPLDAVHRNAWAETFASEGGVGPPTE